jgi:hypothetical protein
MAKACDAQAHSAGSQRKTKERVCLLLANNSVENPYLINNQSNKF